MLCPACLLVPFVVATNQLANKVVLVDGTSCANLKTSAATLLSVDSEDTGIKLHANQQSLY